MNRTRRKAYPMKVKTDGEAPIAVGTAGSPISSETGAGNTNRFADQLPEDFVGDRHVVVAKREVTATPNWASFEFEETART